MSRTDKAIEFTLIPLLVIVAAPMMITVGLACLLMIVVIALSGLVAIAAGAVFVVFDWLAVLVQAIMGRSREKHFSQV